jgi:hypothetical protein
MLGSECPVCADDETLETIPTMEAVDTCCGDRDTGYVWVCPKCDHQTEYTHEVEYEPEMSDER